MLRDFVAARIRRHGVRAVSRAWGVGHETLRKFANGATRLPHARHRELYGARYLEHHPAGYVAERALGGRRPLRPLKMLLPPGRDPALAVLRGIFAAASGSGGAPPQTAAVGAWVCSVLEAEYEAEGRYASAEREGAG